MRSFVLVRHETVCMRVDETVDDGTPKAHPLAQSLRAAFDAMRAPSTYAHFCGLLLLFLSVAVRYVVFSTHSHTQRNSPNMTDFVATTRTQFSCGCVLC
jgi:hypothetical protein